MMARKLANWFWLRDATPELVLAQFTELHRQVPLLYALLAVNSLALAFTHHGFAPFWMTIVVPGALVLASVLRLIVWIARRNRQCSADSALHELRKTHVLAAVISAGYVAWALRLSVYGGPYEHAHVAMFIAITVIGCILCLTNLPQAALSVTVIVTVPYLAYYLTSGNLVFQAIGLNMLLVTGVMIQVMLNNFAGFRQLVMSKGVTERLSRDNLRMAHTDPLTGLPNRRSFFEGLDARFEEAAKNASPLTVGVLDLDNFKPVNDTYGHVMGDRLLEAVARRLCEIAGPNLLMARLGGDEFAFLLDCDADEALILAGKACRLLAEPFYVDNLTLGIGASCGIAAWTDDIVDPHEMFDRADYVLYSSKASNRGGVTVYSAAHETEILSNRAIEATMRTADFDAEIHLWVQPIVNGTTNEVFAVEALARWKSPVLGDVSPASFIAVAERAGLMHDLTLILLKKALVLVARLPERMKLSFNLSAHDITSSSTMLAVVAAVRRSGIDPRRLIFELTETAVIMDFKAAEASVQILRSLGCLVALDDFGTGYSSLSHLHRLSIDRVKIDRSFMRNCDTDSGRTMLRSILALCSSMKLECIAEGVEDAGQLSVLCALGYENFQGYFFARPMTIDGLEGWMAAREWDAEHPRASVV